MTSKSTRPKKKRAHTNLAINLQLAKMSQKVETRSAAVLKTTFTEEDYLLIDWVHQENTGPKGEFSQKIRQTLCCWEVHYIIRTIPGIYFSTPELAAATMETIDTEFDEYELFYAHKVICDHSEIGPILAHILNEFLDNGTHLLAAQAKLIPMTIADFVKKHGEVGASIDSKGAIQITYEWDPKHLLNLDFFQRPLTSSPYPYI